ncbi:SseB family protein [Marinactinospora thermotolerans]|uniref:SseB protein N-terminal domain-containing protein n=1 Tax=Marinactinospora thermotolerans DSM 45154 TaxID=1122192 RepID=A0A1T4KX91_9ACTN|nr:SseB family protein [Marinactinospora thermotolerans]SJZ47011.1 SseB protein N-terminal domain-containing protein [Marinactinospora thermotolerans DSM 45154]
MKGPTIIGAQRFRDDDGSADPEVREKLDAYSRGAIGERQVLAALGPSRLLVPMVAVATEVETDADGLTHDKKSDVAVPILVGRDGRRGMLAFTSVETVKRWREDARPVPVTAVDACRTAVEEGTDALVIDVAGPVTYAVQGRFLATLAEHGTVPSPKDDPQVLGLIYRITHTEFGIERVRIHESDRADIGVRLELERRDDESLRRVAQRLAQELAPLLPGGVELSAVVRARRD